MGCHSLDKARAINKIPPTHDKSIENFLLILCPRHCPRHVNIHPRIKAHITVHTIEIFKKAAIVPAIRLSMDIATEKNTISFRESFLFLSASASKGLQ